MAILGKFTKQPNEVLDYDVDYTDWFAARTDTPSAYVVLADTGITVVGSARTGNIIKIILAGGTTGTKYKIQTRLTTTASLVKEAEFTVAVKEI